ncbi:glycosyltransferase family 4 protein [Halalkalicoccus jeotgali]|uniref:Lipopolysaccharide transferase family protein n=1 Tax=Halalkalicoccus jeotgali (strain DSM 18796 / CECT 7217 / JCM 14584 / KCTC 4019 / B3) TaxID=795797 RepID=D8J7I1_HALJB|nr:glycosyltransferase family 4 protein [Halalkalicoccus jeotgali]ADJ14076.1 lipopolysaccharide transferase family protein [Halalkalicoccus jeotgali B3]ELY33880.1 lipopolysaccharide transferase family protein [Halalkalicoccus jeotgali B3]
MEIAYVLSQNSGGLPHYAAQLANAVAKHADVTVFKPEETTADDVFSEDVRVLNTFESMNISLPELRKFNFDVRRNLKALASYKNLRLIEAVDPDIVHDPTGLFPQVKFFAKRYRLDERYPFVVTHHEVPVERVPLSRPPDALEGIVEALIPDLDVRRSIVHTENQRTVLRERVSDPESVSVIPHGVNDMFGEYDYEKRPEEPHTVLFFGHIIPAKGIDTLVKAMALVRERVPDATLLVAGNGRFGRRSREIIDRHPDTFEIHDHFIPNDEVGTFFSRAALVAVPYRRQSGGTKGHSGTLATAFAFGKPVVASTAGEFSKLVGEAGCGEVVPPEDPNALADAIVDLLEDPEKRTRMGENSALQGDRLSWDSIAERYLDLYESILEEPRSEADIAPNRRAD